MEHKPVKSSNIDSIAYDPDTSEMQVRFRGGGTYSYAKVPQTVVDGLMNADSVGSHFHQHIKGKYDFTKAKPNEVL